jgi:hypothetical protein
MCVQSVDDQCVLQFTLINAAGCVLHRPTSRVIHRSELYQFANRRRHPTDTVVSPDAAAHRLMLTLETFNCFKILANRRGEGCQVGRRRQRGVGQGKLGAEHPLARNTLRVSCACDSAV